MKLSEALAYLLEKEGNRVYLVGGLNDQYYSIISAPLPVLPSGPLFIWDDLGQFIINSELWEREWERV